MPSSFLIISSDEVYYVNPFYIDIKVVWGCNFNLYSIGLSEQTMEKYSK